MLPTLPLSFLPPTSPYRIDIPSLKAYYTSDPKFAIHFAVLSKNHTLLRTLLSNGHNTSLLDEIHASPARDGTPLHLSVWLNDMVSLKWLLQYGADVNALDTYTGIKGRDTPLRLAVRLGRRDIVRRLWVAGADWRKGCDEIGRGIARDGMSLIGVAAAEGWVDILGDLLSWNKEWGGDEEAIVLKNACVRWDDEVVDLLLKICAFSASQLEVAMFSVLSKTLTGGQKRSVPERFAVWEMHCYCQEDILAGLLDAHVAISGNPYPRPASYMALLNNLMSRASTTTYHLGAWKALLSRGADPNLKPQLGEGTLLHLAAGEGWANAPKAMGISLLLQHHARTDIVDEAGRYAIDVARGAGQWTMVSMLEEHAKTMKQDLTERKASLQSFIKSHQI